MKHSENGIPEPPRLNHDLSSKKIGLDPSAPVLFESPCKLWMSSLLLVSSVFQIYRVFFQLKLKVPTKSSKCQFVNSAKKVSEFTYQMTVLHECELQEQLAEGLGADQGIWGIDFKPHCSVSILGMD